MSLEENFDKMVRLMDRRDKQFERMLNALSKLVGEKLDESSAESDSSPVEQTRGESLESVSSIAKTLFDSPAPQSQKEPPISEDEFSSPSIPDSMLSDSQKSVETTPGLEVREETSFRQPNLPSQSDQVPSPSIQPVELGDSAKNAVSYPPLDINEWAPVNIESPSLAEERVRAEQAESPIGIMDEGRFVPNAKIQRHEEIKERKARVRENAEEDSEERMNRIAMRKDPSGYARMAMLSKDARDERKPNALDEYMNHRTSQSDMEAIMWDRQTKFNERVASDIANLYRRHEWVTESFLQQIDAITDTPV